MDKRTLARAMWIEGLVQGDVMPVERAARLFDDLVDQGVLDDIAQRAERILACVPQPSAGQVEEDEEWAGQRGEILDLLRGLAHNGKTWYDGKLSTGPGRPLARLEEWRQRATNVLGMIDT